MKKNEETVKFATPIADAGWALAAARILLGGVYLVSGLSKLLETPQDFQAAIESYQIIPQALAAPLARVLPWVELLAGWFLATGYITRITAAICGGLSSVFFLLLISTYPRGISLADCGCFGRLGPQLEPWQTTLLDAALIGLSAYLVRKKETPLSLDNWINR